MNQVHKLNMTYLMQEAHREARRIMVAPGNTLTYAKAMRLALKGTWRVEKLRRFLDARSRQQDAPVGHCFVDERTFASMRAGD